MSAQHAPSGPAPAPSRPAPSPATRERVAFVDATPGLTGFTPETILALQRTAGNAAVCRALARAGADAAPDTTLDADVAAVKHELDHLIYTGAVEERVIAILQRRANAPPSGKLTALDQLFTRLRTATTVTGLMGTVVSYYDLLFDEFDRADEIRALRDSHSPQFIGAEPLSQAKILGTSKDDLLGSLWEDVKSGAVERRIYAYCQGIFEAGVSLVEGLAMLLDPRQWPKLAAAIGNLPSTVKVLWLNKEKLWAEFLSAPPEEQARIIGRVIGEIEIQLATMAAAGGAAKAGSVAVPLPAMAEATLGAGGAGVLGAAPTLTIDLGKLGSAGRQIAFMAQAAGDATQAKDKAQSVGDSKGEKASGGSGSDPPPKPEFKEFTKAEFDKLPPAEREQYLTDWMKANGKERIYLSERHHAWPEYLGGPAKQPLLSLDLRHHKLFHAMLDLELPRDATAAFYAAKSPAEKLKDMTTLRRVARDFDILEGTSISKQLDVVLKGTPFENIAY